MAGKALQRPTIAAHVKELCDNPWRPECKSEKIMLNIYADGRMRPICPDCWKQIIAEMRGR